MATHCLKMNRVHWTGLFMAACAAALLSATGAEPVIRKGDRVAIVGDSITEQKLYSRFMEDYLQMCVPQLELTVFQFGWGGERAPGFAGRMENDMVPWGPTLVTTCFGMNDGGYRPYDDNIGKAYENGTRRIQSCVKEMGGRMVVGGPGTVDVDTWRKTSPDDDVYYNENLAKLSEIAAAVAKENGFAYTNLHALMMDVMAKAKAANGSGYPVCGGDGVHPGPNGHLVMAYAFLKGFGLDGDIGRITVDMKGGATATEGHTVLTAKDGAVEIESRRYPFCFYGGEKDPGGTRSILPFLPFNDDLNRFMLVVKNLGTPQADVVWGATTRTFTREQLEAGINLAAEFLENPFCESFRAVDGIVARKQSYETRMIKGMVTTFRYLRSEMGDDPEFGSLLDKLYAKLTDRENQYAAEVKSAVKPVRYTIEIRPKQ